MSIQWTASFRFVDEYIVYRVEDSDLREIARVPRTTLTYLDTDPTFLPNTDYFYRVSSSNTATGIQNYSAVATSATYAAPVDPSTSAPGISETSIAHTWIDVHNPTPVSYTSQLATDPSFLALTEERDGSTLFATFDEFGFQHHLLRPRDFRQSLGRAKPAGVGDIFANSRDVGDDTRRGRAADHRCRVFGAHGTLDERESDWNKFLACGSRMAREFPAAPDLPLGRPIQIPQSCKDCSRTNRIG